MAHEMTENDSAVYYKKRAWHNLGNVVEDVMSINDAYDKSGLDWDVYKSEHITVDNVLSEDYRGIIREDTNEILGIVSPRYQVVQNSEIFDLASYFSNTATVESAGSIQSGRKNYLLLHSDSFDAGSNDTVEQYMALFWGHDGTSSIVVLPTSIRVVCKNTMDMALASNAERLTIKHHGDIETKIENARDILRNYKDTGKLFQSEVRYLSTKDITTTQVREFFYKAYSQFFGDIPVDPKTESEENDYEKACEAIINWEDTFNQESVEMAPSPWLAVNAVTNYIQHRVAKRGRTASDNTKAYSNLFGKNAKETKKVMQMALTTF